MSAGSPVNSDMSPTWRACSLFRAGRASEFIRHLRTLPELEQKRIVLYGRVSSKQQQENGNLDDQVQDAIRWMRELEIDVEHYLVRVVAGVEISHIQGDRSLLQEALDLARMHGAIVVAASRDRFIRCHAFDGTTKTEVPMVKEYFLLQHMAHGVPLGTLTDPDQPARSEQIRRGQRAKNNRGGRPPKRRCKAQREARINHARQLRADGLSLQQITDELNRRNDGFGAQTRMTVHNWLKRPV